MQKEFFDTISKWFEIAEVGGITLPDGWFGRPYDTLCRLTFLQVRPHKLLLELDEQILLIFTEAKTVYVKSSELVVKDFEQLVFDWQEFGSLQPHATIYKSGIVKFIPPIGVKVVLGKNK